MTSWQTAQHRVSMAGSVSDAESGKPLGGVDVRMTAMPPEFSRIVDLRALQYGKPGKSMAQCKTRSRLDGLFYFEDLIPGEYTVSASLAEAGGRYGTGTKTATVLRTAESSVPDLFLRLELRPTTIKGKVSASGRENGMIMAEIFIKGSGERTFSDANGAYVLSRIEPGKRTVQVVVQGYVIASKSVTLDQPGALVTEVDFVLERDLGATRLAPGSGVRGRSGGAHTRAGEAGRP